jgi:hypothetical protein
MAAGPLQEAIMNEPSMQGEVVVMKDILHVGPLKKEEGNSFSQQRSAFWQQVMPNDKNPVEVDDMERLLEISNAMYKDEDIKVWFWMAPWPADVMAYYWMLPYLSKHKGRFFLVSIANLPFLDEAGKVFYPKNISEILPRELIKARRLAREVTFAEIEVDGEEWRRLVSDNAAIRTHGGGKKIASQSENYYDDQLLSFCSHQFQKAQRIVNQAMNKYTLPTGDVYLGYRLRRMAEEGKLVLQGDPTKMLKDFEVKLPGGNVAEGAAPAEAEQTA